MSGVGSSHSSSCHCYFLFILDQNSVAILVDAFEDSFMENLFQSYVEDLDWLTDENQGLFVPFEGFFFVLQGFEEVADKFLGKLSNGNLVF